MNLRFVGVGAAFAPELGNNGAFFTRDGDMFLLDCGEQSFAKLKEAGLLQALQGDLTVLITHLHADHCGSLATLCLYMYNVLSKKVHVVHPNPDIKALLSQMGAQADIYSLQADYDQGGLSALSMPVRHAKGIDAHAYLLTDESGTVYYSGDAGTLPPDVLSGVQEGRIRHAYVDVADMSKVPPNPVHLPYATLLALVPPALRRRFTLMHFNHDFRPKAEADGFLCAYIDPIFT